MTGVEILATSEVVSATEFNWTMFWITAGIVVGIMFLIGTVSSATSYDLGDLFMCILFGVLVGSLLGVLVGSGTSAPTEYETHYKVTISDEVSMNEFLERYEILDQEGKIYTVRERDGVEDGK
jgi:hypothetical protein